MKENLTVIKLNADEKEVWRYSGEVIEKTENRVVIEARFNKDDFAFNGILLKRNDRFVETYYTDRWYNIFEIYDRDDGLRKGWYCNVTKPAQFEDGKISYVDLALDLLVFPDGTQLVLDEDEFEALDMEESVKLKALQGLEELKAFFTQRFSA